MSKKKKFWTVFILILVVGLSIFIYVKFFYVFSVGVKSGHLNYVTYKGYIFKTYEGKLIQSGFRSKTAGALGSNEFIFSVADEEIANRLMVIGGHEVDLHYKEYLGVLPWRGYSKYIVDSVMNVRKLSESLNDEIPVEQGTE